MEAKESISNVSQVEQVPVVESNQSLFAAVEQHGLGAQVVVRGPREVLVGETVFTGFRARKLSLFAEAGLRLDAAVLRDLLAAHMFQNVWVDKKEGKIEVVAKLASTGETVPVTDLTDVARQELQRRFEAAEAHGTGVIVRNRNGNIRAWFRGKMHIVNRAAAIGCEEGGYYPMFLDTAIVNKEPVPRVVPLHWLEEARTMGRALVGVEGQIPFWVQEQAAGRVRRRMGGIGTRPPTPPTPPVPAPPGPIAIAAQTLSVQPQ